jgi:hypothetical protein
MPNSSTLQQQASQSASATGRYHGCLVTYALFVILLLSPSDAPLSTFEFTPAQYQNV